jgi:hypothetical protein
MQTHAMQYCGCTISVGDDRWKLPPMALCAGCLVQVSAAAVCHAPALGSVAGMPNFPADSDACVVSAGVPPTDDACLGDTATHHNLWWMQIRLCLSATEFPALQGKLLCAQHQLLCVFRQLYVNVLVACLVLHFVPISAAFFVLLAIVTVYCPLVQTVTCLVSKVGCVKCS